MCRYATHIDGLLFSHSHNRTKYKMATTFGLTYENWSWRKMKAGDVTTWERTHAWCSAVGKVTFCNDFINPELVL